MELRIQNLSKTYANGTVALQNVSLHISKGIFGLLGPNGAGKSTLMRTIATLQEPDTGNIFFDGENTLENKQNLRKSLGYLPQQFGVYPRISAETLLLHLATLKGITNKKERKNVVDYLLHRTNLYAKRKQNLGGFSGGMKQRFGIAQALLTNPKLLIVDEPTAGLDPSERNRFYNFLSEIGQDTVVILSTHIVEDVKELCTNMAIINQGKVLLQDTPKNAIANIHGTIFQKSIAKEDISEYQKKYTVIANKLFLGKPVITIYSSSEPGNGFHPKTAGLEDVYFYSIAAHQ
ncbi:ABC transporter ATP-binding protein [Tenacibaculum sp. SG-28]|uniref:ABC transporter ATP-binding protein n=1 Tax=Tenacibaculum sp. SG-28 TaxID=754426 RepID=UPI000CF425BF|nr:ABC transporter ATP-binding protein [Tenacibaculum sp. SG-28]PQJ20815.1 multidrug ABC transporter ATP-binding protein [Tenacibaculum sp. SG-28]